MDYNDYPIDIVIPWVDGSDEEWLREKEKYSSESTSSVHIFDYQDWDLLKYWFRGIEKYAPWVNKIHFVTWGHLPDWLDVNNPKIHIVNHEDYLPEEYRPVFSPNPIELNFHRIEGLAEHFIYFNDDMFLIGKTKANDFFYRGLPCDAAIINPIAPANNNCIAHMQLTNAAVINEHFQKHSAIKKEIFKWFNIKYGKLLILNLLFIPWSRFPGLLERHLPASFLKTTYEEVWSKEPVLLDSTSKHKFRNYKLDVNQWLIKEWQIASGNFWPRSLRGGCLLQVRDKKSAEFAVKKMLSGKYYMICVNDHVESGDFKDVVQIIQAGFEQLFPGKSKFEL